MPYMEKADQQSTIRRLQNAIRGEPVKRQSLHEALMAAGGIPVKHTPKAVKRDE